MFRRGSHGRRGDRGRSYGRGHLGRRDRSIMAARRVCRSVLCGNRGVARVGSCFAGGRAYVGESPADTAGPVSKVRGRACPL
jgi:hypothetical protein